MPTTQRRASTAPGLHAALLDWYARHRRDLPWRRTRDPYTILLSEVMLQQTQVHRVIPKYHEFLERFPTFHALAGAPLAEVIRRWAPLGYNRRAVRLHRVAQAVVERHGGTLPSDLQALLALDGIGPYTAAAVVCFAFGHDVPVLDTNVRRVLARVLHGPEPPPPAQLRRTAQALLPSGRAPDWNQALMDLGATVCLSRQPRCPQCPLQRLCLAADAWASDPRIAEPRSPYPSRQTSFRGSSRYYRGRILAHLRSLAPGQSFPLDALGSAVRPDFQPRHLPWLRDLVEGLERDGLLRTTHPDGPDAAHVQVSLP